MRQVIIGMIIGIIAGIIAGATVIRPHISPQNTASEQTQVNPDVPTLTDAARLPAGESSKIEEPVTSPEPDVIHWRMTSAYSSSLPVLGELPRRIEMSLARVSGNQFRMEFHEPGTLVPPEALFEAVRSGTIQAGFASPALWADKIPALQLFSSIPFGPKAREVLAWFHEGGGREIFQEIYGKQGIHSLLCGVTSAEASGWFRKPVTSVNDLKGMRMRISGLGARIMEKLGVTTEILMNRDIVVAMNSGAIDAAEFSQPATDFALGLHQTANIVYFPGWHQPATLFDLMINEDAWQTLPDSAKAQIETVCGDNIWRGLAAADARQFATLKQFTKLDIEMKTWPPDLLQAFRAAWAQVVREQSAQDKNFKRIWASIRKFREEYGIWRELSAP